MTAPLDDLTRRYRFNEQLLHVATDGFTDDAWSRIPERGGNTAHWILGHVAASRLALLRMTGADAPPEAWEAAFGRDVKPDGPTDGYPAVDELVGHVRSAGERIAVHFAELDSAALAASIGRAMPDGSDTVGGVAHFMYFHETYHLGQLGYVRRLNGLPGFV